MTMARDESLDLDAARERFEESTDFTMAVEEEFAILDPGTLDLAHGFERDVRGVARRTRSSPTRSAAS